MNIIIFSRDRSSQLELLIRSMKAFFKEFYTFKIKILYKYTNDNFKSGYDKLFKIHPDENIIWKLENNFQIDLMELFDKNEKYCVFFVDDIVFKEPFTLDDERFKIFESHGDILCFSLRLHPKLSFCYPVNINMRPPIFDKNNIFMWKGQDGDFGYPMSLDGHIFRTKDINFYISYMKYNGPNSLESMMASQPLFYPKMICCDKSIIVNNPINKVQNWNNNLSGKISHELINEQFLKNKIIDLNTFIGIENISCHQEIQIKFIDI